ncbi:MAG: S8 family serine peptidase [Flavobacteriales bacterium]|nr:S8 family serine peptidase [Flavobacteriales bacterium]
MRFFLRLVVSALLFSVNSVFLSQEISTYFQGELYLKLNSYDLLSESAWSEIENNPTEISVSVFPFSSFFNNISIKKIEQPFGLKKKAIDLYNTFLFQLDVTNQELESIIKNLNELPEIDYAEPVYIDEEDLIPNDPSYNNCWHLDKIQAHLAWDINVGNSDIVVSIVDDAITINHPDLQEVIWVNPNEIPNNGIDDDNNGYIDDINGWDTYTNDNNPSPHDNTSAWAHGTHCAGIAGAATDNGIGIAAIGFGVSLMAVKTADDNGLVNQTWDGVYYSIVSGADVISCSWSSGSFSQTNFNIIQFGINNGSIIVAASGNNNANLSTSPKYPACYDGVICVANTNSSDTKVNSSNYGTRIDISAPGSSILSTIPYNGYDTKTGTSMSAPMVAGLLGLMKSHAPSATNDQLISCLKNSADNIYAINPNYAGLLGAGRINAYNALICLSPPIADFDILSSDSCNGRVYFYDRSSNFPTTWQWDYNGDGTIDDSIQQGEIIFNQSGVYNTSLLVSNDFGSDSKTLNNAFTIQLTSPPNFEDVYLCEGDSILLESVNETNLQWYSGQNELEGFHNGNSYSIGPISADTSIYVTYFSDTSCLQLGPRNFPSNGFNTNTYSFLVFDVYKKLILQSVDVKAVGTEDREIIILDSNENIVFQKTFAFDNDGVVTLELNASLYPGNSYKIGLSPGSDINLYRTSSNVNFPYVIDDVLSINKSKETATISTTLKYYYFFNWKVCDDICESQREEIKITLDDCKGIESLDDISLFPNPNYGNFTFRVPKGSEGSWMILNQLGQVLTEQTFVTQAESVPINVFGFSQGVYYLSVEINQQIITKKFVVVDL